MKKTLMDMPTKKINIFNTFWDLLLQWKAMLIVALLIALLTSSYKYANDTKEYKAQMESKRMAEEMANVSVESQINDILDTLPDDKVAAVEYLIQQKEWVKEEKEYINHSLLMKENPTNQRTLLLDYYLSSEDDSEMILTSLAYGYITFFTSETIVKNLKDVIDPELDDKYIVELITAPNRGEYIEGNDNGDVILEAKIVLPENVEASSVEKTVTAALKDYSPELSKTIGLHTIELIGSNETRLFNSNAVNTFNAILVNVYSVENYIKNMEGSLSAEQKEAVDSICTLKNTAQTVTEAEVSVDNSSTDNQGKPGFSKKYLLAGFVLGLFFYAGLYLIVLVFKKNVMSPDVLATYTGSRLLGEIYYSERASGIRKLLHSNLVSKIRYRKCEDNATQIAKTVATIDSICEHCNLKHISILNLAEGNPEAKDLLGSLITGLGNAGVTADSVEVSGNFDEKSLLPIRSAIIIAGRNTKLSELWNLAELCRIYDIDLLGDVYISGE